VDHEARLADHNGTRHLTFNPACGYVDLRLISVFRSENAHGSVISRSKL